MYMSLLTLLILPPGSPSPQISLSRFAAFEIPLRDGVEPGTLVDWGRLDRAADHATVAINSDHDILVAYHSTRTDLANEPGQPAFSEPLKQVEIAIFKYDSLTDSWNLFQSELLGSVLHDPLNSAYQEKVRCERPDVIAVGNRFFVVWTRRYDRNMPGFELEPAVLECAWIQWNGSSYSIYNNSGPHGKGVNLDLDYKVRECAGVPDAVLLDPGSATTDPTVGVVYPHQTNIGDVDPVTFQPPGDNTRLCDLRLIITSLTSANVIPPPAAPVALVSNIQFNGATAPLGMESAGLILPDCAPGQRDPVTLAYRFWLVYEEQFQVPGSQVPDGRIRLQLWEQTAGTWGTLATHTFGQGSAFFVRRRPNLSAHPETASGMDLVSIAFSKSNSVGNGDVVYEEWRFDPVMGLYKVIWTPGLGYDNTGDDDIRPIPLHGRTTPLVRRVLVDRNGAPCQILQYDLDMDSILVKRSSTNGLGRPAVAYRAGSGSVPDDMALAWEEKSAGLAYFRIWLRVD